MSTTSSEVAGSPALLFAAGRFPEAATADRQRLAIDAGDVDALARLAYADLLANRLDSAESRLAQLLDRQHGASAVRRLLRRVRRTSRRPHLLSPAALLAEVCDRRGDFARAAGLYRVAGDRPRADLFERMTEPYRIHGDTTRTTFVVRDPLPVIEASVNGGPSVRLLLDTGAGEVMIDTTFADELGVERLGLARGTMAGGRKTPIGYGRIDSLGIGSIIVENVPARTMSIRPALESLFDGMRIDGIIGTSFLYHFLPTIDYPHAEMMLRRRTADEVRNLETIAAQRGHRAFPFWLRAHYILTRARIGDAPSCLVMVDTGLAGGAVTAPRSTMDDADIILDRAQARDGVGGGGLISVIPFDTTVALVDGPTKTVRGLDGVFPPELESALGFRVGGMIGHEFFAGCAVTFDFSEMRLFVRYGD